MDRVGELFSSGEIFVPEMLMSAEAMKSGVELLRPHLVEKETGNKGTVVIGTVKGDLHDIGKNLVVMMMESAGFEVIDLGVDVESDTFIDAAVEKKAGIIALSALLTTTMSSMEKTIQSFRETGLEAKVIIGGAPVTREFADRIGADGYSDDAPGAVRLAKQLLS
jgi:5-methyltetrahydrofolate--homocysteine methyltransferase